MQGDNINDMDNEDKKLLKDLSVRVRRMETALLGDDLMGSTGFVRRYEKSQMEIQNMKQDFYEELHELKKQQMDHSKKIQHIYTIAITAGVIFGAIFEGIKFIF